MVTDDPEIALRELERGESVVLIVGQDSDPDRGIPVRPAGSSQGPPGRLAVMIGDPCDPATIIAAQEMHDELFRTGR